MLIAFCSLVLVKESLFVFPKVTAVSPQKVSRKILHVCQSSMMGRLSI